LAQFAQHGRKVSRALVGASRNSRASGLTLLARQLSSAIAAQLHATALRGRKSPLGAVADEPGLQLRDSGHLLKHEAPGGAFYGGKVREAHVHASVQ
jgi:hypothetical protein